MSQNDKKTEQNETASTGQLADSQISSNKRIAKNAMMLYIRMFISMIVGLYTSRVVLNTLGVEDYGIYGVVGSVVAMMGFLNSSMAGATSRFITFELGKGNLQRLKDTFSSSMIIHIGIAIVVLIVAETVGLWFLNNKLVIPPHRMYAAHWVYQLSILSAMFTITQVPYNACIIAHERMSVYAYIEILNVTLKLIIVYLLVIGNFDKLILYASLTLAVSIIVMMIYRIYCIRKFQECHFHWIWNKEILRPLLSFSGWDLYGNMCVVGRTQGINILINVFIGAIANAANNIAVIIQGLVLGLVQNSTSTFKPPIIKAYSSKNLSLMKQHIINASKINVVLMCLIALPVLLEIEFLVKIWLGTIPPYTISFIRCSLIFVFFSSLSVIIAMGIHATGNIKRISIINGTLYLSVLPISYIFFKYRVIAEFPYFLNIVLVFIGCLSNVHTLHIYTKIITIKSYIYQIILPIVLISGVVSITGIFIQQIVQQGIMRLILICLLSSIQTLFLSYFIVLNKEIKELLIFKLKKIWSH